MIHLINKKIILFLAILLFFVAPQFSLANISIQSAPTSGLKAHWTFDNKTIDWSGNTISDISENTNDGTLVSMSQSINQSSGKIGQALFFDGNFNSISLATNPLSDVANPSSVCAWVKANDVTVYPGGWNQTFLNLFTNSSNAIRMGSVVNSGSFFVAYRSGGTYYSAQTVSSVFTNNTWTHVCYVWNGSGLTLYANGSSYSTTTNPDAIGLLNTIGAQNDLGEGTWYGSIDEINVFDRALTATEVLKIYKSGSLITNSVTGGKFTLGTTPTKTLTSGLVGWWTFDGTKMNWATNKALDSSGNGNDGTITNMSTTTSPVQGKIGQGLGFDGVDDYVDIGSSYNGVKTVSFWIKPTTTTQEIIDLNGTANIDVSSGTVLANNFTSPSIYIDGTLSSTLNTGWHHIVVTTDTGLNASALKIGLISSTYFTGLIDDVRIYSRVLSDVEIRQFYMMGR